MNKAFFLDRDGVLNTMIMRDGKLRAPYTKEDFNLFPKVKESLLALKAAGYLLVVVTNQPDVSRGWVSREAVEMINDMIKELLPVDDIEVCYHTDADNCECRKPKAGMLLRAAQKWNINLIDSYMVGDRFSDVEAGIKAGCRTILIGPGDSGVLSIKADLQKPNLWGAIIEVLNLPGKN